VRVAIVDDDPWVRSGRAAALADRPGIDVVAVLTHQEASGRPAWDDVDVLLVDAHDPTAGFDRFAGVAVVEHARRLRSADELRIVVLTGHAGNDLLRIRMAEAGADALHAHAAVATVDDLVGVLTAAAPLPRPSGTSVNDAVRWAQDNLGADTLDVEAAQKALPVSRRRLITARRHIGDLVDLPPPRSASQDRRLPDWRDVARFLQRARGAERRRGD
jgi:DNA-binding NarL/FixJ family response regulator